MQRVNSRLKNQDGTALIIALLAMMLLTALGAAVVMVSSTEVKIASNYSTGQEALYAADAAVERVMQDLLLIPRWNDVLSGTVQSSFLDGSAEIAKQLPGGGTATLCTASCGANTATGQLQATSDAQANWGANNPQWRLFAWGPVSDMLTNDRVDSNMYVAVWIADDPSEEDNNALVDTNGVLTLHAEAYGPNGTRKTVEVTIARTSNAEIERGQIAQRGQEELNQRARKAAVGVPGKSLTNMRMNTATGVLR